MSDNNALPPSKKRAAGREISKDNPGLSDEEDVSEQETGTFSRASDEVLASRRIVKVRRRAASSAPTAPASNPFAGIRLVPPGPATAPDENKNEEKAVDEETKVEIPPTETPEEQTPTNNESKEDTGKAIDKDLADTVEKAAEEETLVQKSEDDRSVKDEATPVDGKDEAAPADGKDESADAKAAEEGTLVQKNEDYQSIKDEATPTDGKDDSAPADGKDEAAPADSKDETVPADGEEKANGDNVVDGNEKENGNKEGGDNNNSGLGTEATPLGSFQQHSSTKNAFTGFAGAGPGFSASPFSFGALSKDGSPSGSVFSFGSKTDQPSLSPFSFGTSNGSTPLFGTAASANKSEGTLKEIPVETGEEDEDTVFTADSALFEYSEGGWRERGKGEVKINVSDTGTQKARLVMRARGNYRLILNAKIFPDMKMAKMDKKGITFACVNTATEGKTGLATFALKFKEAAIVETFSTTVGSLKGEGEEPASALKTPENSPDV